MISLKQGDGSRQNVIVPADYSARDVSVQSLSAQARGNKMRLAPGNQAVLFSCDCNIQVSGNTIRGVAGKLKPGGQSKNKVVVPLYVH